MFLRLFGKPDTDAEELEQLRKFRDDYVKQQYREKRRHMISQAQLQELKDLRAVVGAQRLELYRLQRINKWQGERLFRLTRQAQEGQRPAPAEEK